MKLYEYLGGLRGKRIAVLGAGISNSPLIELLLEHKLNVTVHDKREFDEIGESAARFRNSGAVLKLGEGYLDEISADVIYRTPGLMPSNPAILRAVEAGAVLTSEMEAFFEVCPCKIIAVTGSDGKTTTTSIIAELLKKEGRTVHLGGNIGTPLLSKADDMCADDIAVLELSSFQLITMTKRPDISVVTNVTPNHLDIHTDMNEYISAKRNVFAYQDKTCRAVFNADNEITAEFAKSAEGEVLMFSRAGKVENGVYLCDDTVYSPENGESCEILKASEIYLRGAHNTENYMAAFAAVRGLVSVDTMRDTARTFKGVAHRIELVGERAGVRYYNDSIASSPTRTIAGLRAFDRKVILIAGGKDKGVGFEELGSEILKKVKLLVLTGLTAGRILKAVVNSPGYIGQPRIVIRREFKDAVLTASQMAKEGDVVLLSPACTSFDRFKNFEERGDTFREIVSNLE